MTLSVTLTEILTGKKPEKFQVSRIKEAAAHVGLSLLLLLWRVLTSLKELPLFSLNKSWSIALVNMATRVATEDGWIKLSNTLKTRILQLKKNIPTLQEMVPANVKKENIPLVDLLMSPDVTTLLTHWPQDQFQLQLMPQFGLATDQVF